MNTNGNGNGHGARSRWWSLKGRRHPEEEMVPYRRLALQLHHDLSEPGEVRAALVVTATTPSTASIGAHGSVALALCLADELRRPVLLVDACPRRPEASRILDCSAARGFADFLSEPETSLDQLVLPTSNALVSFMPAGINLPSATPASSGAVAALLRAALPRFDFVLFCGGAVLTDSISLALVPSVGCVLLLAVEDDTRLEDLEAAQETLGFCRARKVGVVLTKADPGLPLQG
jgi:Mrp family chromosome partitioning ATPase